MHPLSTRALRACVHAVLKLVILCAALPVAAADVVVTGAFRSSAQNASDQTFQNTTTQSQYCHWQPDLCQERGHYVFDVPVTVSRNYVSGDNIRTRMYASFPAQREVILQNQHGDTARFTVAFSSYSGELAPVDRSKRADILSFEGGCSHRLMVNLPSAMQFGVSIKNTATPSPCYASSNTDATSTTTSYHSPSIGLGLRIVTPAPTALPSGVYTGNLTYSLGGAGNDIDFGDEVTVSDSTLTVRFEFTVTHELDVIRLDESEKIELVPEGGWSAWTDPDSVPRELKATTQFRIFTKDPIHVTLRCQYGTGSHCAIRSSQDNSEVEIFLRLTFGGWRLVESGIPIHYYLFDKSKDHFFEMYDGEAAAQPSIALFAVNGAPVSKMLSQPGSTWSGNVTLIFETSF
ncbi:MAG TPA: hypothetical protein VIM98_10545 [Dyella sp.]|uniref:hypothetical protein n=1 Tax=Dyella sp. TaxID=1869338 RepID=UPI002F95242D